MNEVSRILTKIGDGDPSEASRLLPLVYDELRRLAAAKLARERPGQTLQATALVHEAYLRLTDSETRERWNGRGHFFAASAEAMRRILVENARHKQTAKRGGGWKKIEDAEFAVGEVGSDAHDDLLTLDEALTALERVYPEKAKIVKLRFFAGLTIPDAADAVGVSRATAERHWTFARAWLKTRMKGDS